MIFSDVFKFTLNYPAFSPNGAFLAVGNNYKLIVRDTKSMQVVKIFTCIDSISEIKWSKDSVFVLCVLKKRNTIQVWSLEYNDWQCKINEGSAGLVRCDWCPDGRHILTTLDFFIRLTLWSVEEQTVSYMKYPKNCRKYYDFSEDGRLFALAERRSLKDHISVFQTDKWRLLKNFPVATDDLDGVMWMPQGALLCWENCLRYSMLLYNINGELLRSLQPSNSNPSCEFQLGIRVLRNHPAARLIIIGTYSHRCDVVNAHSLSIITDIDCSLEHRSKSPLTESGGPGTPIPAVIYYCEDEAGDYRVGSPVRPYQAPLGADHALASRDKKYISDIRFSFNGIYFFTRFEGEPNVLLIWNVKRISLSAVLIHNMNIKSVSWSPNSNHLALVTGNDRLYMWTPQACISVKVPDSELSALNDVSWNPSGICLNVSSKMSSCVVFVNDDVNNSNVAIKK